MSDKFFEYGELSDQPYYPETQKLQEACRQSDWIKLVEFRKLERHSDDTEDIIVVEVSDGTVPSRNRYGIFVTERLAITYRPSLAKDRCPYDVRAMRRAFPLTPHQNHVGHGEPKSLCLYFQPWSALERSWTPQQYLQRILWWLKETAEETLHREDQPPEPLYFTSPWQIILPHDFHTRIEDEDTSLILGNLTDSTQGNGTSSVYVGNFLPHSEQASRQLNTSECIVITCPAVTTGVIEAYPHNLQELHDQLASKDIEFCKLMKQAIINRVPDGVELNIEQSRQNSLTFVLLHIPVIREATGEVERFDSVGFILGSTFTELGLTVGALSSPPDKPNKIYKNYAELLGGSTEIDMSALQQIQLMPVEIRFRVSRSYARKASGVNDETADFSGVIAGVGALGSNLANLWSKEAWGHWTYVDDDILQPHNTIRHIGQDPHIGYSKAEAVRHLSSLNHDSGLAKNSAIVAKIDDTENQAVTSAISKAELLVDVTTTLTVPRDLSRKAGNPRMVSVFVSPSGRDSVMLLEDKQRTINLVNLEAQYYRAILADEWGENHLAGHQGNLWVGAGCRDVSNVISYELIQLHSAILARQIRQLAATEQARIKVWVSNDVTGQVKAVDVPAYRGYTQQLGDWSIHWDQGLQEKLSSMREQRLPNETGGVLLGYLDQKTSSIHLVDALPAPKDSVEATTEFVRGKDGLLELLKERERKTANIVRYVGEWHSHPPGVSTNPSNVDLKLLAFLTEEMATEGLPAVMAITGDAETNFSIGQSHNPVSILR